MKPMQEGKLVLLCVQNDTTKLNAEGCRVSRIQSRRAFCDAAEIVMLDPGDSAESSFLGDLKIDPETATAVPYFWSPLAR